MTLEEVTGLASRDPAAVMKRAEQGAEWRTSRIVLQLQVEVPPPLQAVFHGTPSHGGDGSSVEYKELEGRFARYVVAT